MNRPHGAAAIVVALASALLIARTPAAMSGLGFELVDATTAAGVKFEHFTGASGRKYLPETLGSGVAVDMVRKGERPETLVAGWADDVARFISSSSRYYLYPRK